MWKQLSKETIKDALKAPSNFIDNSFILKLYSSSANSWALFVVFMADPVLCVSVVEPHVRCPHDVLFSQTNLLPSMFSYILFSYPPWCSRNIPSFPDCFDMLLLQAVWSYPSLSCLTANILVDTVQAPSGTRAGGGMELLFSHSFFCSL